MTLTENQKTWFDELISEEIKEEEATVSNEEAWADGSDGDAKRMHLANAEEHHDYIKFLETLRKEFLAAYEKDLKDAVSKS